MNNHSTVADRIHDFVVDANRDISWLAAIHVITKSKQQDILPQTPQLLLPLERNLCIQNLLPTEGKRKHAVAANEFHAFCDCASGPPGQNAATKIAS